MEFNGNQGPCLAFRRAASVLKRFLFYEDISKPVSRTEASALKIIVEEAVICVNPHATVNVAGGFRR
ncbi:DNA nucleotidylexotransferase [Anabarilius grahami]|uniref:DNA nucleotidylexotransferase n=1 Tax=Anabarilius grahami TaxID=495550 RepID=A0A3N0XZ46_ANAGA|nr:DNA nucleotidylexotransferase [Anabarilius grahami]